MTDTACGMDAVHCDLCGAHLGYQTSGTWVDPEMWIHNRCPVRLAEHWGLSTDVVEELTDLISAAVASCYPEIPSSGAPAKGAGGFFISGLKGQAPSRLRGHIAAGHLMEVLAAQGFQIRRQR